MVYEIKTVSSTARLVELPDDAIPISVKHQYGIIFEDKTEVPEMWEVTYLEPVREDEIR